MVIGDAGRPPETSTKPPRRTRLALQPNDAKLVPTANWCYPIIFAVVTSNECRVRPHVRAAFFLDAANNERVSGHVFGDWLVSLATIMMSEKLPRQKMIGVGATFNNSAIASASAANSFAESPSGSYS